MRSARGPVVILHLSDLHFGPHCRFGGLGDAGLVEVARRLAGSVDDARKQRDVAGRVGLVIASGDIAEYGYKDQYAEAGVFFVALAEALALSPARVLFVPGNHDISWPHCRRARADQEIHGFDDAELARRIQRDKLTPYRDFQDEFYGCPPGRLGGATALAAENAHAFVHSFDDLGLSVAAIDSCERENDREHGGLLGKAQAQALMDHWREDERPYLRVVAVHHNPVADAPKNVAAWAEGLKKDRPDDDAARAKLIDHFVHDATGFEGHERLRNVTRDCRVSLVLHGHVHTPGLASWPHGGGFDHTLVSAAGSWGLMDGKRPEDEPMTVQLLHLGKPGESGPRVEAVRLRYDPRARGEGHVEPGDFVIDSAEHAVTDLPLSLPSGHPGFRSRDDERARPSEPDGGERAGDDQAGLDRELDELLDSYRKRYQHSNDDWDVGGLGVATEEARDFRPSLQRMYVPLRFRRVGVGGHGSFAPAVNDANEDEEDDSAAPIEPDAVVGAEQPMLLSGTAGRGKTTWMRWTFCELLKRSDVVPFFVELRSLTLTWDELPPAQRNLERYLATRTARDLDWDPDRVHAIIKALLAREYGTRPILLIDGWDELGDLGRTVRTQLQGLLAEHPRVGAVVTSRPHDPSKPGDRDGFEVWELQPLRRVEIDAMVDRYFGALHSHDSDHAKRGRDGFQRALEGSDSARDLAQTPLLLTMMLIISRSRTLPDKRHQLYQYCIEALLVDRPKVNEEKGVRTGRHYYAPDDKQDRLKLVAGLARRLQERPSDDSERVVVAERSDVIAHVSEGDLDEEQSRRFVAWLVDIAGLLVEREGGERLSFVHLSFQEYLCAWHLCHDVAHEGTERRLALCRAHMNDLAWWETLRLWAAMVDGSINTLAPVLTVLISGRVADEVEDPIERNEQKAIGFWLAGAILADGNGRENDCRSWIAGLKHAFTGLGYQHMCECARAWRSSGQSERRSDLEGSWPDLGGSRSWLEWQLAADWSKQVGLAALPPAPTGLAAPVIELIEREGKVRADAPEAAAREVALSRVLTGATPRWPVAPVELALLRLWPSPRLALSVRLQSLICLGRSRASLNTAIERMGAVTTSDSIPELARRLARDLAQDLTPDWARYLARDLARYLARDLARYWVRDWARYLARDLVQYFPLDLALEFARYLARYLARDLAVYLMLDLKTDLAQVLAQDLGLDPMHVWMPAFVWIEVRSLFVRASMRASVARTKGDVEPLVAALSAACRISFTGEPDPDALAGPLAALPKDTHDIWPALARWLSRCADERDEQVLRHHAANPDDCDPPLSWGMKYIVRGDLVLEDFSEVTLDELYDQAGVARLPLLEPMPDEIDLGDLDEPT
ncbi:metallophosphoesterase [Haliangium sp.]|uniref:metallophosphoesterase n=1 Tax=Haliangium sp. TaxID=2663208 RepID=UPI003D10FA80